VPEGPAGENHKHMTSKKNTTCAEVLKVELELEERVKKYWAERGAKIQTWTDLPDPCQISGRLGKMPALRSDMINGLPEGYRYR